MSINTLVELLTPYQYLKMVEKLGYVQEEIEIIYDADRDMYEFYNDKHRFRILKTDVNFQYIYHIKEHRKKFLVSVKPSVITDALKEMVCDILNVKEIVVLPALPSILTNNPLPNTYPTIRQTELLTRFFSLHSLMRFEGLRLSDDKCRQFIANNDLLPYKTQDSTEYILQETPEFKIYYSCIKDSRTSDVDFVLTYYNASDKTYYFKGVEFAEHVLRWLAKNN